MPKLERLLLLARLIRERRVVSVDEMRRACGVSDRTIYRYLSILGRLEVLSQGRDDTRTARLASLRGQSVRATDLELLSFVLSHNPLIGFRYTKQRLAAVKAFLEGLIGPLPEGGLVTTAEKAGSGRTIGGVAADAALEAFLQARVFSSRIRLRLKGRRGPGKVYRPRGIQITGQRLNLLVTEPGRSKIIPVDLDRVAVVEAIR